MGLFGKGREERERAETAQLGAERAVRAEAAQARSARSAERSQGIVVREGETVNITGQAIGRDDAGIGGTIRDATAEHAARGDGVNRYIQNTGGGRMTITGSAVGPNASVVNSWERQPASPSAEPSAETELEAGA